MPTGISDAVARDGLKISTLGDYAKKCQHIPIRTGKGYLVETFILWLLVKAYFWKVGEADIIDIF